MKKDDLKGKLMLDAGCGNGKITHWFAEAGAEVVGLDLSNSVERASAHHGDTRTHFVQGSVLEPPLKRSIFDIVFSSGVLHHTPDTRRSFESIAGSVKQGGTLCIWVYRPTLEKRLIIDPLRSVVSRLPTPFQNLAVWGCYLIRVIGFEPIRRWLRRGPHRRPTRTELLVPITDWLTPRYAYDHTPDEVAEWYRSLGFKGVKETTRIPNGFSMVGLARD